MAEPSDPRVFFAAERTMLAWLRTGLAVMGVGFLVARFGLFLRMIRSPDAVHAAPLASTLIGVCFVLLGAAMIGLSAWQHRGFVGHMTFDQRPQNYSMRLAIWVSGLVALLGAVLAAYLVASIFWAA